MFNESFSTYTNLRYFKFKFLIILTMMSVSGLIASDIYLPAMPLMGQYFKISSHATQLTISIYLFGLGVGQLILGPISEVYGRRKLSIICMILFATASLACALSNNYYVFMGFRLCQAIGSCAGLVIGRAIIGDMCPTKDAAKVYATIFPFVGMSPAISPFLGGYISTYLGWRYTFIFLAIFALLMLVMFWKNIPETHKDRTPTTLKIQLIVKNYIAVLLNRNFIAYASAPCFAYIAYFAYITQSPFIFSTMGYRTDQIGFFYITLSLTYVIGNLISKKMIVYKSIDNTLKYGYLIFISGGILIALVALFPHQLLGVLIAISVLTMGNGFLIPMGSAGAVSACPSNRGYASGLLGFFQLVVASTSASLIGPFSSNKISCMGIYILFVTIFGGLIYLLFKYKPACCKVV